MKFDLYFVFLLDILHLTKKNLYLSKYELQKFCEIVGVSTPIDEIFEAIDTDEIDGQITCDEFVDYFTNPMTNPNCLYLQRHIEKQPGWLLLEKALRIFDLFDEDHSGKLEYKEFETFGKLINLNREEIEQLWDVIDKNKSGTITIDELFEWFRETLHSQKDEISSNRGRLQTASSLSIRQNDHYDLEDAKSGRIPVKDEDDDDDMHQNNHYKNKKNNYDNYDEKDEIVVELGENVLLNKQSEEHNKYNV